MITTLEQFRLRRLERQYGSYTSTSALQEALYYDGVMQSLRPGDAAWVMYKTHAENFLALAELLEKQEEASHG
jgi:hypothetical protein